MSRTSIVVKTDRGAVVGFRRNERVVHFRGIPYAAAPFGERRFLAPVQHEGWTGYRDATVSGSTSPQHEPAFRGPGFNYRAVFSPGWIRGDETLNLNVWTPELDARLPVMVWIHGGAFNHGNGAVPMYDGTRFAEDGVVLVTINYRLGAEGFLKLEDGDANAGIQDQIAALAWVQRNIDRFGGDPGNVTIFGESAGAMSVGLLLTAPGARGLFAKAISQSGAAPSAPSADEVESVSAELGRFLGLPPTRGGIGSLGPDELLDTLDRSAAASADPLTASEGGVLLRPYADGTALPADVRGAFVADGSAGIPVIWGFNSDEVNLFTVPNGLSAAATERDLADYAARVHADPAALVAHYRALLPEDATPGEVRDRIQTWHIFGLDTVRAAGWQAATGARAWLYEFAWRSPQLDGQVGAAHLVELPYVFDHLDHPNIPAMVGDAAPQQLADELHGRWVAFARDGDPGWPEYGAGAAVSRVFDQESRDETGRHDADLRIWAGVR